MGIVFIGYRAMLTIEIDINIATWTQLTDILIFDG
jgi:hypothetical protein